jgi:G3E family GTPase
MSYEGLIPVNVVTGFLGSGKTTLLQRLLKSPKLTDTAILVNEFGEVGLDHQLLQNLTESMLLMDNGCLCCAIRGDLQESLIELFEQRERGEIPAFRRVVIETSGLADPVPIAYTLLADPVLQHHFRLGNVITTVDAVNGADQLERFEESVKQVAVADRLVLTKSDLAAPDEVAALRETLQQLNVSAPIFDAGRDDLSPERLIIEDLYDLKGKAREVAHWLEQDRDAGHDDGHDHEHEHEHGHTSGVSSFVLQFDAALDWTAFGVWMTMLLNRHGDKVLRIKGLLNVIDVATPVLINGVQHIVHPPAHLEAWPDDDRRSRLIFIVRDISRTKIEASLAAFNGLANAEITPVRVA